MAEQSRVAVEITTTETVATCSVWSLLSRARFRMRSRTVSLYVPLSEDLLPEELRNTSMSSAVVSDTEMSPSKKEWKGPFKATQIWQDIIQHLHAKVEVKRRRQNLRSHSNCFTGSDAVDVVLHYLLSDRDTFSSDLTREKAVKLCQTLMNRRVFEPVGRRGSDEKPAFEDGNNKLYRFVGSGRQEENGEEEKSSAEDKENDEGENTYIHYEDSGSLPGSLEDLSAQRALRAMRLDVAMEPDVMGEEGLWNPLAVDREGRAIHRALRSFRSRSACRASSCTSRTSSGTSRATSCTSAGSSAGDPPPPTTPVSTPLRRALTPEVVDEVWREVALSQLLGLVDLAFLDGILAEEKSGRRGRYSTVITNAAAKHGAVSISEDSITQAALDLIECFPKSLGLLSDDCLRQSNSQTKLKLFNVVAKHYKDQTEPVLPERFLDLHVAIVSLILQRQESRALEALRLDMILLPWAAREELHRLLAFMRAVAQDHSIALHPKETNEVIVLREFSDSIFRQKVTAPSVCCTLAQFLLHHQDEVFRVPPSVEDKVNQRLDLLRQGCNAPVADAAYCNRVSTEEMKKQAEKTTEMEVVALMNAILNNSSFSSKEKRQKLKQFQKCHPAVFQKHFAHMLD